MEKKNSDSPPETDLAKALQLALTLDQLRQNQNLEDLEFTRKVMKNIREIPRIKPPPTPLKLSEIAPTIPKYEEMPEEERGILARIKKLFKRKSGGVVPA